MSGSLSERCRGRWRGLLPRFGVHRDFLDQGPKKHGPCPVCGGKDRFRFDDEGGRGTFFCNQCGAGDGFELLKRFKGWSFKEAAEEIDKIVGSVKPEAAPARKRSEDWLKRIKNDLWQVGRFIGPSDPAGLYLAGRGIRLESYPPCLRFVEHCRYDDKPATHHPAMVARFVAPDGTPSTLHRTYLTMFGQKADVPEPRLLMPGGMAKGGAVRLAPTAPVLGIAEGIETALSATLLFQIPCWSALNAHGLMTWEPPDEVREVVIFPDNDASFTGLAAAYNLANRLTVGRKMKVTLHIPPDTGSDWNDALQADAA